jgi:hypothetical protein
MKFFNVFLAAVTVVSSMPTPQEGVFLEPVDREIMVVEKYNYNDFISSFFFKESAYEAELPNGVGSACERTPFRVDELSLIHI